MRSDHATSGIGLIKFIGMIVSMLIHNTCSQKSVNFSLPCHLSDLFSKWSKIPQHRLRKRKGRIAMHMHTVQSLVENL